MLVAVIVMSTLQLAMEDHHHYGLLGNFIFTINEEQCSC